MSREKDDEGIKSNLIKSMFELSVSETTKAEQIQVGFNPAPTLTQVRVTKEWNIPSRVVRICKDCGGMTYTTITVRRLNRGTGGSENVEVCTACKQKMDEELPF